MARSHALSMYECIEPAQEISRRRTRECTNLQRRPKDVHQRVIRSPSRYSGLCHDIVASHAAIDSRRTVQVTVDMSNGSECGSSEVQRETDVRAPHARVHPPLRRNILGFAYDTAGLSAGKSVHITRDHTQHPPNRERHIYALITRDITGPGRRYFRSIQQSSACSVRLRLKRNHG